MATTTTPRWFMPAVLVSIGLSFFGWATYVQARAEDIRTYRAARPKCWEMDIQFSNVDCRGRQNCYQPIRVNGVICEKAQ
jgi:hypothetical protein